MNHFSDFRQNTPLAKGKTNIKIGLFQSVMWFDAEKKTNEKKELFEPAQPMSVNMLHACLHSMNLDFFFIFF